MTKSYLLLILLLASIPVAYAHHECTPNTPENCNILDSGGAPHQSGIRTCQGVTFGNTIGNTICGMSNTEIFIHAGQATERIVPVFYEGTLIDIIDVGAKASGKPHDESLSFGGKIAKLPFWAFYEVSPEGTLLHKGEGYQYVFRDNLNEYIEDPDGTIQRQINSAKIRHSLFHLWQ